MWGHSPQTPSQGTPSPAPLQKRGFDGIQVASAALLQKRGFDGIQVASPAVLLIQVGWYVRVVVGRSRGSL
jgi:hypothetical protein